MIVKIIMVLNGLIAALSFLFFRKRTQQMRFLGVNFFCQLMAYVSLGVFDLRGMDVNTPSNIQLLSTFLMTTAVYSVELQKRHSRFFLMIAILFAIFWFVNFFFIQKTFFNSYTASIGNFIAIGYCIFYFYRLLVDLPAQNLLRLPMFWISAGLLVQSAGVSFLYIFTEYLTKFFFNDVLVYWTVHNLLIILGLFPIIIGVSVDLKNAMALYKTSGNVASKESSLR